MPAERITLPGDGVRLAADAYGAADAPPVLFFHGGGQSRRSWSKTARRAAAAGYRGITVDLRGHGESEWAEDGDYHVDAFGRDVAHILDHLGRPTSLVGASRGGQAALIGASQRQQHVAMVMLADVAPRMGRDGIDQIDAFLKASLAGFDSVDEAADTLAARLGRPRMADPSGLRRAMRVGEDGRLYWNWDPQTVRPEFIGPPSETTSVEAAARLMHRPVVVVRGTQSNMVSEDSIAHFREVTPGLVALEAPGAGHMFTGDSNDDFAQALFEHLPRHAG